MALFTFSGFSFFFMRKNRKQLRSFLKYPEFHSDISSGKVSTVRLSKDDVSCVESYLDCNRHQEIQQEKLLLAVEKLDDLVSQFNGDSLESLYQEVPSELKGKVELFTLEIRAVHIVFLKMHLVGYLKNVKACCLH